MLDSYADRMRRENGDPNEDEAQSDKIVIDKNSSLKDLEAVYGKMGKF